MNAPSENRASSHLEHSERGEDFRVSTFAIFALIIAITIGGCIALSVLFLRVNKQLQTAEEIVATPESAPRPTEPLLQSDPQADLNAQRIAKQKILHSYSWIDRPSGIARIPIDQAIDHAVAHGLPSLRISPTPQGEP